MTKVTFEILGRPYALRRPRFAGHAYDPPANKAGKAKIAEAAKAVWGDKPLLRGAVRLTVIARYQWPKSATKAQRRAVNGFFKATNPDLDNIVKAVMDALNGVVWEDDQQVVAIYAEKIKTTLEQATKVAIEPLSEIDDADEED